MTQSPSFLGRSGTTAGHALQWQLAAAVCIALAASRLLVQLEAISRDLSFVGTALTIDDTFYYVVTAWNHSQLGWPTFDGINPTNGVQLLWYLILWGVAKLSATPESHLRSALAICAVLNAASFFFIWRISRLLAAPTLALFAAASWFVLISRYLTGMENSLHALLWWWLVYEAASLLLASRRGTATARSVLVTTVLCSAVVWARLDSTIFVLPLFAVIAFRVFRDGSLPRFRVVAGWALGVAVAFALLLGAAYYSMAGSIVPVSVGIKAGGYLWDQQIAATVANQMVNAPLGDLPMAMSRRVGPVLTALVAMLAVGVLARWWRRDANDSQPLAALTLVLAASFASSVAYVGYMGGLGEYAVYGFWYFSPVFITVLLVVSVGLSRAVDRIEQLAVRGATIGVVTLAGVLMFTGLTTGWRAVTRNGGYEPRGLYVRRLAVANHLKTTLQRGEILAAWNAGQLAFFSGRPVVNLDGLINSPEYARLLKPRRDVEGAPVIDDPAALIRYLRRVGVDYVVDWDAESIQRAGLTLVDDPQLATPIRALDFEIAAPGRPDR